MKIMGFNFTKFNAEKFLARAENIKLSTNIDISDIKNVNSNVLKSEDKILGVNFTNIVNYEPNFAKIELKGNVLIALDKEQAEEVIKEWENKKIPEEFKIFVFNLILKKSTLKALQFEEELNIPLHVPLPSLKASKKKE